MNDFIKKANNVKSIKYDYSKVKYVNNSTKVIIGCLTHGDFEIRPNDFLRGGGCQKCSGKFRYDTKSFIKEAVRVHGDEYDYSELEYVRSTDEVIISHKCGYRFKQRPATHLNRGGCLKCSGLAKDTTKTFITKARGVHGNKYDYSKVDYTNNATLVTIVCPEHGEFNQTPANHSRHGCIKCSGRYIPDEKEYLTSFKNAHGDKYNYSKVVYVNNKAKVIISCPEHGDFEQIVKDHSNGCGCPKCGTNISFKENEILAFIRDLGVECEQGNRSLISPYEIDILIPEYNLAIEYNGLRWHSERTGRGKDFHKTKTDMCTAKGYRLIHVWEDDYLLNKTKILSHIEHILKPTNERIYARKTKLVDIVNADIFFDTFHIQGSCKASIYKGLEYKGEVVAIAAFAKGKKNTKNKGMYELVRYATSTTVIGGLGKLVKNFNKPIYTFCDDSFFTGSSYLKAGFCEVGKIKPDYKYVVNNVRVHKFNYRKSNIKNLHKDVYSDSKTELEMMTELDYFRVWDCGKTRYELTS